MEREPVVLFFSQEKAATLATIPQVVEEMTKVMSENKYHGVGKTGSDATIGLLHDDFYYVYGRIYLRAGKETVMIIPPKSIPYTEMELEAQRKEWEITKGWGIRLSHEAIGEMLKEGKPTETTYISYSSLYDVKDIVGHDFMH